MKIILGGRRIDLNKQATAENLQPVVPPKVDSVAPVSQAPTPLPITAGEPAATLPPSTVAPTITSVQGDDFDYQEASVPDNTPMSIVSTEPANATNTNDNPYNLLEQQLYMTALVNVNYNRVMLLHLYKKMEQLNPGLISSLEPVLTEVTASLKKTFIREVEEKARELRETNDTNDNNIIAVLERNGYLGLYLQSLSTMTDQHHGGLIASLKIQQSLAQQENYKMASKLLDVLVDPDEPSIVEPSISIEPNYVEPLKIEG